MASLDFIDRATALLREIFGPQCDLRRGNQDNDSFGDAVVEARIGKAQIQLTRLRGELSATVVLGRGQSHKSAGPVDRNFTSDTEENLRLLVVGIADRLRHENI